MISSRIRSLHVVFSFDNKLGGAVHTALSVAKQLVLMGHSSEVVASYAKSDDTDYLRAQFGEVLCHRIPRTFPQRYNNAAGLKQWLEANLDRFDVVELHSVWSAPTARAWRVCRRLAKPFLVRPHASLDPFDLRKHFMLKKLIGPVFVRPMLQDSAGVLLAAQLEADRLVTWGAKPKKFIVPLPVPTGESAIASARESYRAQHGIPTDAPVVLFMSRVDYKKGLEFLIPSLDALRRQWPSLRFVLAGSGEPAYTARIQRLLAAHGALAWTAQTGFLSGADKQAALVACDVFALPSLNENFGMVVVEAMRAGLPLLISDQVYIHQEIAAVGAAVICQTSAASCKAGLQQLLCMTPEQRNAMGLRGRALAESTFSPEAATTRLLDVYRDVLGARVANHNPAAHS